MTVFGLFTGIGSGIVGQKNHKMNRKGIVFDSQFLLSENGKRNRDSRVLFLRNQHSTTFDSCCTAFAGHGNNAAFKMRPQKLRQKSLALVQSISRRPQKQCRHCRHVKKRRTRLGDRASWTRVSSRNLRPIFFTTSVDDCAAALETRDIAPRRGLNS